MKWKIALVVFGWFCCVKCETDPGDMAVLNTFKKNMKNSELLKWPDGGTDPCGEKWPHVFCTETRVGQIQVQGLGLEGPLPPNFNSLSELYNIGLQRNKFSGALPTFKGLLKLQKAYLGSNNFDTIPADFFQDLGVLEVLSLEYNALNSTSGWILPDDLQNSVSLTNLSLSNTSLIGSIPKFLGSMPSLQVLELAYNRLTGPIPSSFSGSQLLVFQANNQAQGLSGAIDVIGNMTSLRTLWLHGNKLNGSIPASIGRCINLQDLRLNNNLLVGPIPNAVSKLPLQVFTVSNNKLSGPIPDIKARNFSYLPNSFCETTPGKPCNSEVTSLLDFLASVNYPSVLASSWTGNNPCDSWIGSSCDRGGNVAVINLPNRNLSGTISPSLADLTYLSIINLNGNELHGVVPSKLTALRSLTKLDLSNNSLSPPLPKFSDRVDFVYANNPLIENHTSATPPVHSNATSSPTSSPTPPIVSTPNNPVSAPQSPSTNKTTSGASKSPLNSNTQSPSSSKTIKTIVIPAVIVGGVLLILIPLVLFLFFCRRNRRDIKIRPPGSVVVGRDPSGNSDSGVRILVSNKDGNGGSSTGSSQSGTSSGKSDSQVIEAGNLVISVQVLKAATRNFSSENELGRGGFGVVYKGILCNGTTIAVKRMEAAVISTKGLNEFQSEIAVLSKVRHRNLVSLLGYSIEGNERLLVYEYMPRGALSSHIFDCAKNDLEPMLWKTRLNIALDVARGMEYLHGLAHRSFIHRDLKPSNILLGDDFRAKVSDFGLVKLAPEGKHSIETRLAGTFGYLAPEYAVTGRITTKADVYSFGVVLMELITGRRALDENEPEESMHLVTWFRRMNSAKETFIKAIDRVLEVTDETFESICTVAELSGHCTAREPYQRPDMGHVVSVLAPLVEKWKPADIQNEDEMGIDFDMSLPQALKKWQAFEDNSNASRLDDSIDSIPTRPVGFAESFTSSDGR